LFSFFAEKCNCRNYPIFIGVSGFGLLLSGGDEENRQLKFTPENYKRKYYVTIQKRFG